MSKAKKITAVAVIILLIAAVFIWHSTKPTYADYTMSDGTQVKWTGKGNLVQVTRPNGTVEIVPGIADSSGHLIPADIVASGTTKITITSTTYNGKTTKTNQTIDVAAKGYTVNGTHYYWDGSDGLIAVNTNTGSYSTISSDQTTQVGDRIVPTSLWKDNTTRQALQTAINQTGGYFNADGSSNGSSNGYNFYSSNNDTISGAQLAKTNYVNITLPDGTTKTVEAKLYAGQGSWAGVGRDLIVGSSLTPDVKAALDKAGVPYDAQHDVYLIGFARGTDAVVNGTVNWDPVKGLNYITGSDWAKSLSITMAANMLTMNENNSTPVIGTVNYDNTNYKKRLDAFSELTDMFLNTLTPEAKEYMAQDIYMQDLLNWVEQNKNDPKVQQYYTDFQNAIYTLTNNGQASFILPPDNTPSNATPSNPTSSNPTPSNPTSSNPMPSNPTPSNPSNNQPVIQQPTADDVHATITITKTPTYVYTKWHKDVNNVPAHMTITISWQNVRVGSIVDMPDGPTEVTTPATITDVVALHDIHRYTNNVPDDYNWQTIYPVDEQLDLPHNKATFTFEYPKPGQPDSTIYFKLYLNGTNKYFCVYAKIPVNGYGVSFYQDSKNANPGFDKSMKDTETISF